jgi:hypothetical protein
MKLSDTEKKTLVDESVKYWQSTLEIHPYDLMNIANYWLSKFDSILEKKEKDIVEMIEEYFKGLIFIPDPQATKENLINKLNNK